MIKFFYSSKKEKVILLCLIAVVIIAILFASSPVLYWFLHDRRLDYRLKFSECKEDLYNIVEYLDSTYSLECYKDFSLEYNREEKTYTLYDLQSKERISLPYNISSAFSIVTEACDPDYRLAYIRINNGIIEFKTDLKPYWLVYSPAEKPMYEKDCLVKKADKNFYHICFS